MASRGNDGISLVRAAGIKNVFVNDWKPKFFSDPKKRIASIPFIRNIIEYTKGEDDSGYKTLTSLLHWKEDSQTISERDLDSIYNSVFGTSGSSADPGHRVVDTIHQAANDCLTATDGVNFENKIVLAIAIRIAAEKFMAERIGDSEFVNSITANQTQALLARFRSQFSNEQDAIRVIQRVALMTPENIHLNSFMYEPILDMSDDHLRKLYQEVNLLGTTTPPKQTTARIAPRKRPPKP
jgi:hypothetical protein